MLSSTSVPKRGESRRIWLTLASSTTAAELSFTDASSTTVAGLSFTDVGSGKQGGTSRGCLLPSERSDCDSSLLLKYLLFALTRVLWQPPLPRCRRCDRCPSSQSFLWPLWRPFHGPHRSQGEGGEAKFRAISAICRSKDTMEACIEVSRATTSSAGRVETAGGGGRVAECSGIPCASAA